MLAKALPDSVTVDADVGVARYRCPAITERGVCGVAPGAVTKKNVLGSRRPHVLYIVCIVVGRSCQHSSARNVEILDSEIGELIAEFEKLGGDKLYLKSEYNRKTDYYIRVFVHQHMFRKNSR